MTTKYKLSSGVASRLWLSTRLFVAVIGCFGCLCVYAMRVNLSVAIVCMVNQTAIGIAQDFNSSSFLNLSTKKDEATECAAKRSGVDSADNITDKNSLGGSFVWTKNQQGLLLGAFFWGYAFTQIVGGVFSQRFGAKRVLGFCIFAAAVITFLTPLAATLHFGVFVLLRILLGFCEGVTFPSFHTFWSHWSPPLERSILTGITYAGNSLGNVVTLPIAGILCNYGFGGGWPSVFYVFGIITVVWFIIWMIFVSDFPSTHRTISAAEKEYIIDSLSQELIGQHQHGPIPWRKILTSLPVWAIIAGHWAGDWGAYIMLTCLPSFMSEVLAFDLTTLGFLAMVPFILFFIGINAGGFLADLVRSRGWLSTAHARKAAMIIALGSQAVFLVGAGHCKCGQEMIAVALLAIGTGLSGFQYSGYMINYMDIAPPYAGTIMGIGNMLSCASGILAPLAMGQLTKTGSREEWLILFYVTAGILLSGMTFFCLFASGVVQPWAALKDIEEPEREGVEIISTEMQPLSYENGNEPLVT